MKKVLTNTMKSAKILTMKLTSSTNQEQFVAAAIITRGFTACVEIMPDDYLREEMLAKEVMGIKSASQMHFSIVADSHYDYQQAIKALLKTFDNTPEAVE